jgi:TonB family protein
MPDKRNTIGRFEIIEKIGEGPIGAVYKALDPVIRRTVAIKVIKLYALEETTTFAEVFEKIYRVVRTSTSLNHPNICIIYDLSEEKKIPYITMEYVDGHDLESLLKQKHQFKRQELLNLLQQTCDALDFAHKKNVIHQDLKSTNILITPDLHVKITDFGIAGLDEIAAAQTKKLLSIPYYISPEQALGERVSPASDLFSLGVVMYHMLSGQLPFPGTTAPYTIMMIARDAPALPTQLSRSAISREDWASFFSIALAKSPNQRFRSAREMLEALNSILPPSDQTYYPFGFEGTLADTTGKFEKTYIAETEAEPASPTVMIDAAKIMEESFAFKPPQPTASEAQPITAAVPVNDQQETEPVELEVASEAEEIEPSAELQVALDAGLQETDQATRNQEPVIPEAAQAPETKEYSMAAPDPWVEKPPSSPPEKESALPADFVPASGNLLDVEEPEEIPTIGPTRINDVPAVVSDTSPILGKASEPAPQAEPDVPLSAPTQLIPVPVPEPSKGNGKAEEEIEEIAPETLIRSYHPAVPEPPPATAATVLVAPKPAPEPPPFEPVSAPTKMMPQSIPPIPEPASTPPPPPEPMSAATQMIQPARPTPPEPPQPQKTPPPADRPSPRMVPPAQPAAKRYETIPPVAPPRSSKPPSMQRYLYAALAVAIFIVLVGGYIFLFRKPAEEKPTGPTVQPKPQQQTTQPPIANQKTPAQPATLGSIMITSEPTGAKVFIGDEEKGMTPVEVPELAFGKYMIKLQLKGYQDLQQEVELTAEAPNATVPITLQKAAPRNGTLIVESEPDGAFIVIDNRVLGVTPKTLSRKPGNYNITLKKDGYIDYSAPVTVASERKTTFRGTLAEIPKPVPVPEPPKPKLPEVTRGQLVTLGPDVVPPKPIKKVYAKYPDAAKVKRLEGTVRLNVLVDETGRVIDMKVMKSAHPMLDEAVTTAYRQWQFEPAKKQGVPVKVWISVAMSFQSSR